MGWPPEPLILPDGLRKCISSRRCVAFIGSGVSSECYPSWCVLVNSLCEHCGSPCRVEKDSPRSDYLHAAEDAKNRDEQGYYNHVGQVFGGYPTETNLLYRALLTLPFKSYITTNLDPLLATEAQSNHYKCNEDVHAYPRLDRAEINSRSIYHLHGIVQPGIPPGPGRIVLSSSEFQEAYKDNGQIQNFLIPTLDFDRICFIGCSLREPDMQKVFHNAQQHQRQRMELQQDRSAPPSPHYILRSKPDSTRGDGELDQGRIAEMTEEEERYYLRLGIHTVWYAAPDEDHSALNMAFDELAQHRSPKINYNPSQGY